jgi:lipoprotein-releasing system permease protein
MNTAFFNYFFNYVFRSRTRQKLIFLTIVGLVLSSFCLTVLQGIMGGLQSGLIQRSKNVVGNAYLSTQGLMQDSKAYEQLISSLNQEGLKFNPELELEIMIQHGSYVSPIILHGIDSEAFTPSFLKGKDLDYIVIGSDLGRSIGAFYGAKVKLTSPAHTDFLFEEIPRQAISQISDFYLSELPEIDSIRGWVSIGALQELTRNSEVNKIRFYEEDVEGIKTALENFNQLNLEAKIELITWEQEHSTLVWALNLETRVMLFLFISMSLLIGICITSGFLIFYNKIKVDLASFWILGLSKNKLMTLIYLFGQGLTISFCALGLVLGLLFLLLLDNNNFILMPEQFVERNIPVKIEFLSSLIAFLVPYTVSSIFTHYTFRVFKNDKTSFISYIRKLG